MCVCVCIYGKPPQATLSLSLAPAQNNRSRSSSRSSIDQQPNRQLDSSSSGPMLSAGIDYYNTNVRHTKGLNRQLVFSTLTYVSNAYIYCWMWCLLTLAQCWTAPSDVIDVTWWALRRGGGGRSCYPRQINKCWTRHFFPFDSTRFERGTHTTIVGTRSFGIDLILIIFSLTQQQQQIQWWCTFCPSLLFFYIVCVCLFGWVFAGSLSSAQSEREREREPYTHI